MVRKVIEGRNTKTGQDSPSLQAMFNRARDPSSITSSSLVAFNTLMMAAGAPTLTHAACPSAEPAMLLMALQAGPSISRELAGNWERSQFGFRSREPVPGETA